jgi:hypothetical protein
MFLHTHLNPAGRWEPSQSLASLAATSLSPPEKAQVEAIQTGCFNPATGTLYWSPEILSRLWKKGDNVFRDKWLPHVAPFLSPSSDAAEERCRRLFVREVGEIRRGEPMESLVEVVDGGRGGFRTCTCVSA